MSGSRIAPDCVAGPQATPFAKGQLEISILRTKSLGLRPRLDIRLMNASRFGVYHSRLLRLQVSIFCLASEGEVTSPTTVIISGEIMLEVVSEPDPRKIEKEGLVHRLGWKCTLSPV